MSKDSGELAISATCAFATSKHYKGDSFSAALMYTDRFAKPGQGQKQEKLVWSVEILPPKHGQTVDDLLPMLSKFVELEPIGVDVTYHQEKIVNQQEENGAIVGYPQHLNPGTVPVCAALRGYYKAKVQECVERGDFLDAKRYSIEIIPHLICGGFSVKESEEALIDLASAGTTTVLALQGDAQDPPRAFQRHKEGHAYASDLVQQIVSMNAGKYIHPIKSLPKTNFCIGVAGYPEKHYNAPHLKKDMDWLKHKVDKGAHYIVTQLFFDNAKYFSFVGQAREMGIAIPIVPGLKILETKEHLNALPRRFHIDIPASLEEAVEACGSDNNAIMHVGFEWARQQCKELLAYGVPALHFYSSSRASPVCDVIQKLKAELKI